MAEKVSGKKIFDWYHILLAIIILAQMLFVTYMFNEYKMGYHSDEIFNYGFANSYDRKEIYIDDNGEEIYNKWLPTTVLTNYITVQEGERFAYDKVYAHAAADINPPFQLFVLHTICSFFPNVYSKWFCFSINIVSLGISLIYIHKSVELISKSKVAAFGAVLLYGFSAGAQSVTVFLRLYALGVMFGTAFFYYSAAIYENINDEKKNKYYIRLGVSLLLGAFTLHFFLPFAFAITFCYTVMYLIKRQFKVFFKYGFTCLGAVIASIVIFPSTISHLFYSSDNLGGNIYGYPFNMQVRLFVHYLVKDILGVLTDYMRSPNIVTPIVVMLFGLSFAVPICFLLRKEKWFDKSASYVKGKLVGAIKKAEYFSYSTFVALFTIVFIVCISAKTTSFYRMGGYGVRYLFVIYPVCIIFVSTFIYYFVCLWVNSKMCLRIAYMLPIVVFVSLSSINNSYMFYMIHDEMGTTLKDIQPKANTIILLAEYWVISTLAPDMGNVDGQFYAVNLTDLEDQKYTINNSEVIYLVMDTTYIEDGIDEKDFGNMGEESFSDNQVYNVPSREEIIDFYKRNLTSSNIYKVGEDEVFGRTFEIYRVD